MDIRKIKKLIELLEESDLAEIEVQEGEESVRISRHGKAVQTIIGAQPAAMMPAPAPAAAPAAAEAAAPPPPPFNPGVNSSMVAVRVDFALSE